MGTYHFLILGSEKRQNYLADFLRERGNVVQQAEQYEAGYHDAVLLPVSQTAKYLQDNYERLQKGQTVYGCNFPQAIILSCQEKEIRFVDYMKEKGVASRNAVATAEGAIVEALQGACVSIHGSRCLVCGYGCCGEVLAEKLFSLKAQVTVMERKEEKRAKAMGFGCEAVDFSMLFTKENRLKDYDFIFNTVPAAIFTEEVLDALKEDVRIIDIASAPGGVDFSFCQKKGIYAKLCPGLPGKYAPKSSARILVEVIEKTIFRED